MSPLRGENPENRPVSKRNTSRAALRADPAGNQTKLNDCVRYLAYLHILPTLMVLRLNDE